MTRAIHLIVGPERHGVCRHAASVAEALGHQIIRAERPEDVDPASLAGADIIHIPYTDRLFAERCEESAEAFVTLAAPLVAAGKAISVTLHDLPAEDSELDTRRRAAYTRVASTARGVVVNSRRELALLDRLDERARSRRRIPLPVEPVASVPGPGERAAEANDDVVVLGFVFPNRGYEHIIDELPDGVDLLALGGPAQHHEDLPAELAALAEARGHRMTTTGFVSDVELTPALLQAGIPVAPNRRVAASASIATWIAHGRRPLVPICEYTLELDAEWPGTVRLYDADVPGSLRSAIDSARLDASLTAIEPGVKPGPSMDDVGALYADHFEATAPDRAIAVEGEVETARYVVPRNRWDLLDGVAPVEAPMVSVVIPYYEAQPQLDRVLTALTTQTHPAARLQVIVADDGSAKAPDLSAAGNIHTVLVRQPDQGFRAAAARNLGAAAADGDVLLFLDGDTSPEPEYVQRLSRLPAIAPDTLAVGRRLHIDLGQGPPVELGEPQWLVDAYRDSKNLLLADVRSYRYVISAVMGINQRLFAELGGFDETFTSYGGEDWELAHRSFVAGAVMAHVRDAVAWHDGPEWAERGDDTDKNAETFALTRMLPDTVTRGGGQWFPYPAVAIQLRTTDPSAALVTIRSAFASNADCGFWIEDAVTVEALGDPRVRAGLVPTEVRKRALVIADLVPTDLARLPELVNEVAESGEVVTPAGALTATRALGRAARWSALGARTNAAQLFGRREYAWPLPFEGVDLHHELKRIHEGRTR